MQTCEQKAALSKSVLIVQASRLRSQGRIFWSVLGVSKILGSSGGGVNIEDPRHAGSGMHRYWG